jgi:hypothetical protein
MPLVTLADLHAPTPSNPSVPVYQSVHTRIHDDAKPMPQPPNPRLGAADLATLDSWTNANAPGGDGSACTTPVGGHDGGGNTPDSSSPSDGSTQPPADDCVFDTHVAPASAFTMIGQEVYACYGFDLPAGAAKRHVTQIKAHIDNSKIVHHALLLTSPTSVGSTPAACNPAISLGQLMTYAWAPGGNPLVAPPEAGFPIDGTTHYVVQIHYNNVANAPNPTDSSGFDLCTTSNLRKYDADTVAFGTELISIPPLGSATSTTCFTVPAGLDGRTFFGAFPHMHKLGTTISTSLRADAGTTDMGTIANWSFSNQPWLTIAATAHAGDVVRASCSWNNPGPTAVSFGEYTSDEMCFSFTAYYPKADASFGWAAPAIGSVPCP